MLNRLDWLGAWNHFLRILLALIAPLPLEKLITTLVEKETSAFYNYQDLQKMALQPSGEGWYVNHEDIFIFQSIAISRIELSGNFPNNFLGKNSNEWIIPRKFVGTCHKRNSLLLVVVIDIYNLICAVLSLISLWKLIDSIDWVLVCFHLLLFLLKTFALFAHYALRNTQLKTAMMPRTSKIIPEATATSATGKSPVLSWAGAVVAAEVFNYQKADVNIL